MTRINLLYGTVYGSAESVAKTLEQALVERGHQVRFFEPGELDGFTPPQDELLVVVTSTTGQGDLPDDIAPWFFSLKSSAPYLPALRYAIVGLGDSSYENFCGGGRQVDELLTELGAKAITPLLAIDAMETMEPEADSLNWLESWQEKIAENANYVS